MNDDRTPEKTRIAWATAKGIALTAPDEEFLDFIIEELFAWVKVSAISGTPLAQGTEIRMRTTLESVLQRITVVVEQFIDQEISVRIIRPWTSDCSLHLRYFGMRCLVLGFSHLPNE